MKKAIPRRIRLFRNDNQLWLPLMNAITGGLETGAEAKTAQVAATTSHPAMAEAMREKPAAGETWTLEEVLALHEYLLMRSMKLLMDSRTSIGTVLEILDWIFSDELVEDREAVKRPFAFQTCLLACGVGDAEVVRQRIRAEVLSTPGIDQVYRELFPTAVDGRTAA